MIEKGGKENKGKPGSRVSQHVLPSARLREQTCLCALYAGECSPALHNALFLECESRLMYHSVLIVILQFSFFYFSYHETETVLLMVIFPVPAPSNISVVYKVLQIMI